MRKTLLSASLSVLVAGAATIEAVAAEQTIYLGGYGGSFERLLKEKILPPFEQETGAKIVYVPGNSTDTLAKLQALVAVVDVKAGDDGTLRVWDRAKGAELTAAQLGSADLTAVDLTDAKLDGADLDRARLTRAILVNVSFVDAKLTLVDLDDNDLTSCTFLRTDLEKCSMARTGPTEDSKMGKATAEETLANSSSTSTASRLPSPRPP